MPRGAKAKGALAGSAAWLEGLINVERRGKNMICSVNPDAVAVIVKYLA